QCRVLVTDDYRRVCWVEGTLRKRQALVLVIEAERTPTAQEAGALPPHAKVRMDKDHEWCGIGSAPRSDVLAVREVGALGNLGLMCAPAYVAVDGQPLATQFPSFPPAPTGSLAFLRPLIPTPEDRDRDGPSERFKVALVHRFHLARQLVARD